MHHIRITFSQIADVVRTDEPSTRSSVGARRTSFRFADALGRWHETSIQGHPRVQPGMSVVAVLARAEDWGSLIGWVDQATGEIAGPEPVRLPIALVALFSGCAGCILALATGSAYAAAAFGAATTGVAIWVWRGHRLYVALAALRRQPRTPAP